MGLISRELAEADTAPLHPLVPTPIPIRGYYVRAMESGMAEFDNQPPVSFKGMTWHPNNYAILIYPAEPGRGKLSYLWAYGALRIRGDDWTPSFQYPSDDEIRHHWGIVD